MSRAVVGQRSLFKHPRHYPTSMMYSGRWKLQPHMRLWFMLSSGRLMLRPPFLTGRENKILSVVVTVVLPVSDGIRFSLICCSLILLKINVLLEVW